MYTAEIGRLVLVTSFLQYITNSFCVSLQHQSRVVAKLPEVLQGLEDMLLAAFVFHFLR